MTILRVHVRFQIPFMAQFQIEIFP